MLLISSKTKKSLKNRFLKIVIRIEPPITLIDLRSRSVD